MSTAGRITEFLNEWRAGHGKPHNRGHKEWGADPCEACTAEAFNAWEAFQHAAWIADYAPATEPSGPTLEQRYADWDLRRNHCAVVGENPPATGEKP